MRTLKRGVRLIRLGVVVLAAVAGGELLSLSAQGPTPATQAHPKLFIEIVQGQEVVNNVKQRVARDPQIVVYDENHNPVNGATVTFLLPKSGPSAHFPGGQTSYTTTTGSDGQATATGLQANNTVGSYKINVVVQSQGTTTTSTIPMANVLAATVAAGASTLTTIVTIGVTAGVAGATVGTILAVTSGPVSASK